VAFSKLALVVVVVVGVVWIRISSYKFSSYNC